MNYYEGYIVRIKDVFESTVNPLIEQPQHLSFPFQRSWQGQNSAVEDIINNERTVLCSHTGSGKSAVVLTTATELETSTLVIEPRKFLQTQLQNYNMPSLFVMFGRKEYSCCYARDASVAPCLNRYSKEDEDTGKSRVVFDVFQYVLNGCDKSYFSSEEANEHILGCNRCNALTKILFEAEKSFPCYNCQYIAALNHAKQTLLHNGILVVNSFNFYPYRDKANFIVIDEADEFFRTVTSSVMLNYVSLIEDTEEMLRLEHTAIESDIKKVRAKSEKTNEIYRLERKLERLQFFISNSDLCFSYHKKVKRHSDRIYVEMLPQYEHILQRLFNNESNGSSNNHRICLVTATPGSYDGMRINYEVPQRSLVLYTPIGKMTSTYIFQHHHEYLLENAYNFITYWFDMFQRLFGEKKCVVHCGNVSMHATTLYQYFTAEGKYEAILHEKGNLKGTVEDFINSDTAQFLLFTAGEYGFDLPFSLNFILKIPYENYDERIRALEKSLSEEEFKQFYEGSAILRTVQACGRVGRGSGEKSFGCSFILDSKFFELYRRYESVLPDWFKKRLVNL